MNITINHSAGTTFFRAFSLINHNGAPQDLDGYVPRFFITKDGVIVGDSQNTDNPQICQIIATKGTLTDPDILDGTPADAYFVRINVSQINKLPAGVYQAGLAQIHPQSANEAEAQVSLIAQFDFKIFRGIPQ